MMDALKLYVKISKGIFGTVGVVALVVAVINEEEKKKV